MRRVAPSILVAALLLLTACTPEKSEGPELATFIGGTQGLTMEFSQLRTEVFDSGNDPFDVVVRLENKGEWTVLKDRAKVRLSGINPSEFGKPTEAFALSPADDLPAVTQESRSSPIDVEFRELNYLARVTGAALPAFPLVATACYGYGTRAVTKLCVRRNILTPEAGGVCTVEEPKSVANSGAPVHIENFREQSRAKDRVAFIFDVKHIGSGRPFELGSQCVSTQVDYKIKVRVDTRLNGLSCTGLTTTGAVAEGTVTLVDGSKTVSCSQSITSPGDYEQPVDLTLEYDYEDTASAQLTVKHAGE